MFRSTLDPAALRQLADAGTPLTPIAQATLREANERALVELPQPYHTPDPRAEHERRTRRFTGRSGS